MSPADKANVERIVREIAGQYGIHPDRLTRGARDRISTNARRHAIALVRQTYPEIPAGHLAVFFGMCDHTSIARAVQGGNRIMGGDDALKGRPSRVRGPQTWDYHRREAGVVLRATEVTKITKEEDLHVQLLMLHSEKHLNDLDAGGYEDASATELLIDPDQQKSRFVPVSRQVLWSSLAQVAA